MLKEEFEKLAGYKISNKVFDEIINPVYMVTKIDKEKFVKIFDRNEIEEKPKPKYIIIRVPDRSGHYETPNVCWYYYRIAEVVDIDILWTSLKIIQ